MSARARAEFDPIRFGVRIAVQIGEGDRWTHALRFDGAVLAEALAEATRVPDDAFLKLDEDIARALYDALGDYFGHSGHDTRALRKDYDAERKRVDTFIAHLTGGPA